MFLECSMRQGAQSRRDGMVMGDRFASVRHPAGGMATAKRYAIPEHGAPTGRVASFGARSINHVIPTGFPWVLAC